MKDVGYLITILFLVLEIVFVIFMIWNLIDVIIALRFITTFAILAIVGLLCVVVGAIDEKIKAEEEE